MRATLILIVTLITIGFLPAQSTELGDILANISQELVDVTTEKYRYRQSLEFDEDKPWRVTITINEVNVKNDKSETSTFYLNLADTDPKLINIETDKEEQLVVMKCRRRQNFIRLTEEDGDISYESELQVWSPEIDKATVLRDLFRKASELSEKAWKADFNPGKTMEEVVAWLAENVISVEVAGVTTPVEWSTNPQLSDMVDLTITEDEGEDVTTYRFSLADLSVNTLKLVVKKEEVSVVAGTVNKEALIQEDRDGAVAGYEKMIAIPVNGIEEAGRIIQVLEAAVPLARKVREARMPTAGTLDDALEQLSVLITGAQRGDKKVAATLSPTPLSTLEITTTDAEKDDTETERFLFDFGDLNGKKVDLRVKGIALDLRVATVRGKDYIQKWKGEEVDGFDDEVAFPVNNIETAHKLKALLPYIIDEAGKIPVPVGDFSTIEAAVNAATTEDVAQKIEQREEDCKWNFLRTENGKKTEEILYEYNLYDLDPKQVNYEVTNKGIFLKLLTVRKEETINVYENDEPSFANTMVWKVKSLSEAKQLKATMVTLITACTE